MLDDAMHFLTEHQEAPNWELLGQHLPIEWVEQAASALLDSRVRSIEPGSRGAAPAGEKVPNRGNTAVTGV